jgi:hypothetical protein
VSARQRRLAARRLVLVERSAAQRFAIISAAGPLITKAAAADRMVSRVRRHPLLVAAVVGAAVLFGSRRLFDMVTRGVTLYALFRR